MSYEIPRIPDRVPIPVRLRDQLALVQRMREAYHAPVVYELAEAQAAFDRAPDEQIEAFAAALAAGDPEPDPVIPAARDRLSPPPNLASAPRRKPSGRRCRMPGRSSTSSARNCTHEWSRRPPSGTRKRPPRTPRTARRWPIWLRTSGRRRSRRNRGGECGRPGFGPVPDPPPPLVDLDPNQVDPDAGLGPITRGARQNAREEAAPTGKPEPKWDQGRTVQRPRHIEASIFHGTNVPAR